VLLELRHARQLEDVSQVEPAPCASSLLWASAACHG
jgi:hypothetical protein